MKEKVKDKVSLVNRKAKYDYVFEKTLIAGLSLIGQEVKAIRDSRVSFTDSYCFFQDNELFLKHLHVTVEKDPTRDRKLLLKRRELDKLQKELINGYTIVPTKIFENDRGILKVEIALARGKKQHDKRESIKERDIKRQTDKELKR
jgi:SsrA-binding protein